MEGLCAFLDEMTGIRCAGFGDGRAWLAFGAIVVALVVVGFFVLSTRRRRKLRQAKVVEAQPALHSQEEPAQGSPLGEGRAMEPPFERDGPEKVGARLVAGGEEESGSVEAVGLAGTCSGTGATAEEPGEAQVGEVGSGTAFVDRLRARLARTQEQFIGRLDRILLRRKTVDLGMLEELEEVLLEADLGLRTTAMFLRELEKAVSEGELDGGDLTVFLKERIFAALSVPCEPMGVGREKPFVMMVVGVNGVGKTTTIGKLAGQFAKQGLKVMLVAADTFRAAAIEQLEVWSQRTGTELIRHKAGADPGGVVFDAMRAAEARGTDVVIIDTAGRLHTKTNLMEELKKIKRVLHKNHAQAPHEILLVVDATTGQNAIQQARVFHEALGVTGLVLTKLDGSAKGGVIVGIAHELQLPVRYIGIGEKEEDLAAFEPRVFVEALFDRRSAEYLH